MTPAGFVEIHDFSAGERNVDDCRIAFQLVGERILLRGYPASDPLLDQDVVALESHIEPLHVAVLNVDRNGENNQDDRNDELERDEQRPHALPFRRKSKRAFDRQDWGPRSRVKCRINARQQTGNDGDDGRYRQDLQIGSDFCATLDERGVCGASEELYDDQRQK